MARRAFNETTGDDDIRQKSLWTDKRLNIQIARDAEKLKRAHDAYDREQEKKDLASLGIDIGEIEDECS